MKLKYVDASLEDLEVWNICSVVSLNSAFQISGVVVCDLATNDVVSSDRLLWNHHRGLRSGCQSREWNRWGTFYYLDCLQFPNVHGSLFVHISSYSSKNYDQD